MSNEHDSSNISNTDNAYIVLRKLSAYFICLLASVSYNVYSILCEAFEFSPVYGKV